MYISVQDCQNYRKIYIHLPPLKAMGKTTVIVPLFLIIAVGTPVLFYGVLNMPQSTERLPDEIDTSGDPLQEPYTGKDIYKKYGSTAYTLEPVATFKASVLVVSTKQYFDDDKELIPLDVCVVWGEMALPHYRECISFEQGIRVCQVIYIAACPFEESYLDTHFTNIHVIPGNENILKALKAIKKGQKVILEGFLVNIYRDGVLYKKTSMSRTDSVGAIYEILYVTQLRIGDTVYE